MQHCELVTLAPDTCLSAVVAAHMAMVAAEPAGLDLAVAAPNSSSNHRSPAGPPLSRVPTRPERASNYSYCALLHNTLRVINAPDGIEQLFSQPGRNERQSEQETKTNGEDASLLNDHRSQSSAYGRSGALRARYSIVSSALALVASSACIAVTPAFFFQEQDDPSGLLLVDSSALPNFRLKALLTLYMPVPVFFHSDKVGLTSAHGFLSSFTIPAQTSERHHSAPSSPPSPAAAASLADHRTAAHSRPSHVPARSNKRIRLFHILASYWFSPIKWKAACSIAYICLIEGVGEV
jgi:hypothetical protein